MNSQCERIELLITDYALGELERSELELVEEHVGACHRCSEALKEVRHIMSSLSHQEMFEPSAAVCQSVREAVRNKVFGRRKAASAVAGLAASLVRRPVFVGSAALIAIAAVTLALVLRGPEPPGKAPGGASREDRFGKALKRLEDYLSESKELLTLTEGPGGGQVLASYTRDDWMVLIGQAMEIREQSGLEAHGPLLVDLEKLYREIMDCNGDFGEKQISKIRQFISDRKLIERTKRAVSWRR